MQRYKYAWATVYTLLLICFTLYVILDSFVLTREIVFEPQGGNISFPQKSESKDTDDTPSSENTDSLLPVITKNSYQDEDINITIEQIRYCDTNVYVADIRISSAEYLKTAFAENKYGKNITALTSETALANSAIFAVNGDYYGARTTGYVIRNGYLYRESASDREALVIYPDGSLDIVKESMVSAQILLDNSAYHVLSFGPGLVYNGEISIDPQYEVGKAATKNPRTAIGMINPLHYIFIVTDGRSDESDGLTVRELASLMVELKVQRAYNLDGGGSSTMYFNGKVVNDPGTNSNKSSERSVSDIVYIGK